MARVWADANKLSEAMATEPNCPPFGFRPTSPKFNFLLSHTTIEGRILHDAAHSFLSTLERPIVFQNPLSEVQRRQLLSCSEHLAGLP